MKRQRRMVGAALAVLATAAVALIGVPGDARAATWETLIDNSFRDRNALVAEWNFNYPWGNTHNGSARMVGSATDNSHVYLPAAGQLQIKASPVSGQGAIHYLSGAIWAKDQVLVNDQFPSYELRGEFQAPSARGAWPAFWITGATSWPPESDILEYKGDNRNWFNTYKPMWIIINLQMEGSSGSPGPSGDTYYSARNVYLGRSRA